MAESGLSKPGDAAGPPAWSLGNASSGPTPATDTGGCENGALMDSFGIFLQGLLAVMAFSILMREYGHARRTQQQLGKVSTQIFFSPPPSKHLCEEQTFE